MPWVAAGADASSDSSPSARSHRCHVGVLQPAAATPRFLRQRWCVLLSSVSGDNAWDVRNDVRFNLGLTRVHAADSSPVWAVTRGEARGKKDEMEETHSERS